MSQEQVEIVRGVYAAWARRDHESAFAAYAPDIEWDMTQTGYLGAEIYHGHDAVRAAFREILPAWREVAFEPLEISEHADHVLVTVRERGVGRASGIVVDRVHYAVWTLRDDKIARLRVYLDRAEALKAASAVG